MNKISEIETIRNENIKIKPKSIVSNFNTGTSNILNSNKNNQNCLRELHSLYDILNETNISLKENFYPSIIITGHEGSGKSSLIEFLISLDLFPANHFMGQIKAPLKIKVTQKNKSPDTKIILNEQLLFHNIKDFQNQIEQMSLNSLLDDQGFFNVEIIQPPKNKLFFDFTIYEVDIENFELIKNLLQTVNIFILCNSCDKPEKFSESLRILQHNFNPDNYDNVLAVMTKPDKIESGKEYDQIQQICNQRNLKFCFIKMKSFDERKNKTEDKKSVLDFIKNQSNIIRQDIPYNVNNGNFPQGLDPILDFLESNFQKYFFNKYKELESIIYSQFENDFENLKNLGTELDKNKKMENLKNIMTSILNYISTLLHFNFDNINQILTNNFYSETNDKFENSEEEKTSYLERKFNKLKEKISTNNPNLDSLKKKIKKKILTKIELENILILFHNDLIEQELKSNFSIKSILQKNLEGNLVMIYKKISSKFTNIKEEFSQIINNFFEELFIAKSKEVNNLISQVIEVEINTNTIQDKQLNTEFTKFYNEYILPNNFKLDENYENFINHFIQKLSQSGYLKIVEIYFKFFSYYFYKMMMDRISKISVSHIIETNFDTELTLYVEAEDVRLTRNSLKENLMKLKKIQEIIIVLNKTYSYNKTLNLNLNISSISSVKSRSKSQPNFSRKSSKTALAEKKYKNMTEKLNSLNLDKIEKEEKYSDEDFQFESEIEEEGGGQAEVEIELICVQTRATIINEKQNSNRELIPKVFVSEKECISINQILPGESEKINLNLNLNQGENFNLTFGENTNNTLLFSNFPRRKDLVMVCDNTNQISIFDYETNSIKQETVSDLPTDLFLEDNRYLNVDNSVFIAGGVLPNKAKSNLFIRLNREDKSHIIDILPSIPEPVTRHSLIYIANKHSLVLAGGLDNKVTFLYNIREKTWEHFGDLKTERIDASLLLLNNNMVIIFGGIKNKQDRVDNLLIEIKEYGIYKEFWNTVKVRSSQPELIYKIAALSGLGSVPNGDKIILLGGYNCETLDDEEEICYQLKIDSNSTSGLDFSVDEIKIENSKSIQSWFPENNFVTFNRGQISNSNDKVDTEFVNFNVDGEIIKFILEKLSIEVFTQK